MAMSSARCLNTNTFGLNKMTSFSYLTPAHLQGFERYKYSCVDTSPLSNYVMHPFWNGVVKLFPKWVAPNLLTLIGWLFILSNFLLLSIYDWDFNTTSNEEGLPRPPIPRWVWLYCGVSQFVGYTLDGIDGKQARRTGSSTPVGELFDHGLDSWSAIFLPMSLVSAFGRGSEWGISASDGFWPCLSALGGFYVSHWEKYITGILYLPWLYDIMQLGCCVGYLATWWYGTGLYQVDLLPGLHLQHALIWLLILGFIGSFPMSIWNIYHQYKNSSSDESPRRLSLLEGLAPWSPFVVMTMLFWAWYILSPTDIVETEPRIFYFTMGVVSSNITCRLIISQMSHQPCQLFNPLLPALLLSLLLSLLYPAFEADILYGMFFMALMTHLHYGMSVVQELCDHFNIYSFSLQKPQLQ